MRISILTLGSRGDVQPYVALGAGLKEAGHEVRVAAHVGFAELVARFGLAHSDVRGDAQAILRDESGRSWLESGRNPVKFMRRMEAAARPHMVAIFSDYLEACRGCDLVLFSPLAALPAGSIAESLGVARLPVYLQHVHPCGAYPAPSVPPMPRLGRLYNRPSYALTRWLFWSVVGRSFNAWRTGALGLAPLPAGGGLYEWLRLRRPCLYGFSRHVVPRPAEWGDEVHLTGYWVLSGDATFKPPPALERFLAAGPAPVYVGFGSMTERDPGATTATVLDAVARTGVRAVLGSGWAGLDAASLPDDVVVVGDVPHDWLFPRMAAVVHHGGAGTTATALRADVPAVVVPFFADQHFWAWRVTDLGAGPQPVPRRRLSAERLAAALRDVTTDPGYRARAAAVGELLRAEDGVARAVEVILRVGGIREG